MPQMGGLLRTSRMKRDLTQEQAVQILPYDLRTLQAYELDERKETPWQAIANIAEAYGDKQLLFLALMQNEAWQLCLPQLTTKGLSEAGCTMLYELMELEKSHQDILRIRYVIEPEERPAVCLRCKRRDAKLNKLEVRKRLITDIPLMQN